MTIFEQYAQIKIEQAELKEKEVKLNQLCLDEMRHKEAFKYETNNGTFSRINKSVYSFSELVKNKEIEVKTLKDEEKSNGTATRDTKDYLRFQI